MEKQTLYLMVGLPRSGKSTLAKTFGCPIVSGDAIREAFLGVPFLLDFEKFLTTICFYMVKALLLAGHSEVVVDDCHLTVASRDYFNDLGCAVKPVYVDTSEYECIRRALSTKQSQLVPVIKEKARTAEVDELVPYRNDKEGTL